jgi:predicted ribosomally synthesized peptide with SipW-like signal peptide
MRKSRMFAGLMAAAALGVGLIGYGVHAAFTSSGTASASVAVGTFGLDIPAGVANATYGPAGCNHTLANPCTSITVNQPTITSSGAGSAPLSFTIANLGTIPANGVTMTASDTFSSAAFSDLYAGLPTGLSSGLAAGATSAPISAGIGWTALSDSDLGKSESVTYTVNAGA